MSCDACQEMRLAVNVKPHAALAARPRAVKIRPLRRQPLVLQSYECSQCGTRWLSEHDPLSTVEDSWICLYLADSIFDPVSVTHQKPKPAAGVRAAKDTSTSESNERNFGDEVFSLRLS